MLIATDPLSLVFIACFLFGLLFLIGSALLGNLGHGGGGSHAAAHTVGHISGAHVASHGPVQTGHAVSTNHIANHGNDSGLFSYVNPTSIVLFLLGFGFFGYVFHNTAHLMLPLTLAFAGVSGIIIAVLLLIMLSRVFGDSEGATVQDVSDRTGLLGKVSIPIRENSLGEIIYISPGGMRKSIPARSVEGQHLERGQEVVVINYQNGVAEVDTWERFINEEEEAQAEMPNIDELAKLRALLENSDKTETELVIRKDLQKE